MILTFICDSEKVSRILFFNNIQFSGASRKATGQDIV